MGQLAGVLDNPTPGCRRRLSRVTTMPRCPWRQDTHRLRSGPVNMGPRWCWPMTKSRAQAPGFSPGVERVRGV